MNLDDNPHAYVEFLFVDKGKFDRLTKVVDAFREQKRGDGNSDEAFWKPYFEASELAAFWWPTDTELKQWNVFWFSTPLPHRHSAEMPTPPWDFGSMVDAILTGEYNIVGVRRMGSDRARLEFDPHAYPFGGTGAFRALVGAFGHEIIGFDDGTGFEAGDPKPPRWMPTEASSKK